MRLQLLKYLILSLIVIGIFSSKAQVVINEVNVNPPGGTSSTIQSVKVCTASASGTEYIELYNKTDCPIDISCYIIGWNQGTNALNGSFRFPSGTTIPAKGFISVGGPNAGSTFNLYSYCSSSNLSTGNTRWYLNNGDGYVCLYNSSGVAVDLVYWTFSSGETSKYGTDSEISDGPTFIANPAGCTAFTGTMLPGPSSIGVGSGIVSYAGSYPSSPAVIGRTIDGNTIWTNTLAATINACNGTCNTIGSCILPIELKSFNVSCDNNQRLFSWETSVEINNHMFAIEQSKDAVNFEILNTVKGAGNSNTTNYYSELLAASTEFKYFRLKQIDYNGSSAYSNILFNECNKSSEILFSISPNPFNNQFKIDIHLKKEAEYTLDVIDPLGRQITRDVFFGNNISKSYSLSESCNGFYFIVLKEKETVLISKKLIKENTR